MIRINLHTHSTCSDGDFSPSELVHLLSRHKVAVAALTDHDTVTGVPVFLASCHSRGIRGVAGCEFSSRSTEGDELHILGYRFNLGAPALQEALARYQSARTARNAAICEKLTSLGLPVTLEEAEARSGGQVVGRPHIAQVLRDKGRVSTLHEAFVRYLGTGAAAFVPRDLPPTEDVIRLILEAGGLPVWAHPLKSLSDTDRFPVVLDTLKESGLWGVECWFHGSSSAQTLLCLNEAGRRGLYATAGTDFHGRGHGAGIAGHVVEDDLLPWARFCGGR
ncbi:MAG: PHP domain-containing protein [Fretibacterium sp.]|nr:PHP domain-containing protein [Fretibacterium sp.]